MIKRVISILLVIISCFIMYLPVHAEDTDTIWDKLFKKEEEYPNSTILGDLVSPGFKLELSDGNILFDSLLDDKSREEINTEILLGTDKEYSIFDRFGNKISFIPYLGETYLSVELIDHIYSGIKRDIPLRLDSLFWADTAYLSTTTYLNRLPVLAKEKVDTTDYADSRVNQYNFFKSMSTTQHAFKGNNLLRISEGALSLISFIISDGFLKLIHDTIDSLLKSGLWSLFVKIMAGILAVVVMFWLIRMVRHYIDIYKGRGHNTVTKFFLRIIINMAVFAFILFLLAKPTVFNDITTTILTKVDLLFEASINDINKNDEIIHSDNIDNVYQATIWKSAIFQPWCRGMFGEYYDKLFTQFAENLKPGQEKMPQDTSDSYKLATIDKPIYESAKYTGDVFVPLGGNKEIRNWAAYALSTQSKYHIDSTDAYIEDTVIWPTATRTYSNSNIYLDTFRWLDAKLNIGAQVVTSTGDTMNNYMNSKLYTEYFHSAGRQSIYLSLLALLPLGIVAVQKLMAYMLLLFNALVIIYHSILEITIEDSKLYKGFRVLYSQFIKYLMCSIKVFLIIMIYNELIGASFNDDKVLSVVKHIFYIFLVLIILFIDKEGIKRAYTNTRDTIRKLRGKRKVSKRKVSNKTTKIAKK